MKNKYSGFTLMELMVVLAIVGILLMVAIPSFNEYIMKSRRSDATAQLLMMAMAQERWRSNRATYANTAELAYPAETEGGYYALAVTANGANNYTMTATPQNSQADERCGTLTLTFDGAQPIGAQMTREPADNCW
jgi:type IV pilus assembly protein PilE